jgi:hypothetical protein
MVESDHAEERLARVERMLAQCRRESAAVKAIASKVVVIVVEAAPPLDAKHAVRPAKLVQTEHTRRVCALVHTSMTVGRVMLGTWNAEHDGHSL